MSISTTNASELTQDQVQTILVKPLEAQSAFLNAGPVIFDTDGSPVRVPKAPGSVADSLTFVAENAQIPEADPDFDEVQLLPSTMQSVKVITRFSNELARQSVVALDQVLKDRLVADVAMRIDAQLLGAAGDGVKTPKGLFAWTGTQSLTAGKSLTVDNILEAQGLALSANVNTEALTLFIRPEDYMELRKLKDADGRYLVQPDVQAGGLVAPILGARVSVSKSVPAGKAALVDMSQVAVARDVAPAVALLDQTYADFDQQAIRVVTRMDAGALNPEAVVKISKTA